MATPWSPSSRERTDPGRSDLWEQCCSVFGEAEAFLHLELAVGWFARGLVDGRAMTPRNNCFPKFDDVITPAEPSDFDVVAVLKFRDQAFAGK
jgi:hypothetical protein